MHGRCKEQHCEVCGERAWRRFAGVWSCYPCAIKTMEYGFDWRRNTLNNRNGPCQ
jgi:ribosomal protein L37AE/L43A